MFIGSDEYVNLCKQAVRTYVVDHLDKSDSMPSFDVYVVWYCKELQNHKALLSTSLPDGMYYECTFNGDKSEMYVDAYKKFDNKVIKVAKEINNDGVTIVEIETKD